jgi:serine/threonine protein kinase
MCIKTLNKAMIKDARRGRRVHQEVFALKTLRHPNVIVLYDVIHTKEHVHIITERLEKVGAQGFLGKYFMFLPYRKCRGASMWAFT